TVTNRVQSEEPATRASDAFGIYSQPTPDWSKLLHALDADLFLVYRAPVSGVYVLETKPEESPVTLFEGTRWREQGKVAEFAPVPRAAIWPEDSSIELDVRLRSVDLTPQRNQDLYVESEPNDTPEQAQPISVRDGDTPRVLHVVGGSDDIEYFDNGRVGSSGDDWFRINFQGTQRVLLTACLSIPDQQVAARIRCYRLEHSQDRQNPQFDSKNSAPSSAQPVSGGIAAQALASRQAGKQSD
ncbi:MAG: hypothetical protein ABGZ17_03205, partial [Planctomycetaceae bacterium]